MGGTGNRRPSSTFRHNHVSLRRTSATCARVLPTKAPRTQRDNLREIEQLYKFFDNPPAPIEKITPLHVRQYLDWRKKSPVRANREKALFSHIYNKAREWGYTSTANPCQGVKGFREVARDIYVEDWIYKAVWEAADWPTRDAMDLAYLTGQTAG